MSAPDLGLPGGGDAVTTPAHAARQSHSYTVHFPAHPARKDDPHYVDFEAYHKAHRAAARCYVGERIGYDWCLDAQGNAVPPGSDGVQPGLELHHAYVEYSLQNGIDLKALEVDFPGISDATVVGAWVESDTNFRWLCCWHHRGPGGAHTASHSDWTAGQYIPGLISPAPHLSVAAGCQTDPAGNAPDGR